LCCRLALVLPARLARAREVMNRVRKGHALRLGCMAMAQRSAMTAVGDGAAVGHDSGRRLDARWCRVVTRVADCACHHTRSLLPLCVHSCRGRHCPLGAEHAMATL
jgi:hypothetical protein